MYARVYIDVLSGSVDRPFDYRIPPELTGVVQPGVRVQVPFGPRQITGIVISCTEESDVTKVKPIHQVLDEQPVLTPELLMLGQTLARETLCLQMTAYQAMLPAALRGKVVKTLERNVPLAELPPELAALFQSRRRVSWIDAQKSGTAMGVVREAVDQGLLTIEEVVKDQSAGRTLQGVQLRGSYSAEERLELVGNRAVKQKELLDVLETSERPMLVKTLAEDYGISNAAVNGLIDKGLAEKVDVEKRRDPYGARDFETSTPLALTKEQTHVLTSIKKVQAAGHDTLLLQGVTGSGKTEVYLQAIEDVLNQGSEAIVLVPEISLTPQMVERFKSRFGEAVAVLHSALSAGEKYDEWRRIHRGEVSVVVGARSAVFAPFTKLGLIIIDEEHEGSYKQEDQPRYHARDIAIQRGEYHNCPVLLGSATPSIESYARARKGVYTLLQLTERVNQKAMPEVKMVDMREELKEGNRSPLSTVMLEELEKRLERGEQSVLFLNRRGFSTFIMCRSCGFTSQCPHCEISLTYHKRHHQLKCHYCGFEETAPAACPECGSEHIRFFGTGTQKVEQELNRLLPEARIIRMDVDTTSRKGAHEALLQQFGEQKADILLGTQMIAKGLDFPNITLAGVLAADALLKIPDFRAAERTFQLLTQVSGRAGRDERAGEVVIQSYDTEHYSLLHAQNYDFERFVQTEMQERKRAQYPPYTYMVLITVSHQDLTRVIKTANEVAHKIEQHKQPSTALLGPVPSPIARIKDRYRYQCMIKYKDEPDMALLLQQAVAPYMKEMSKDDLYIAVDRHPQMFM
ncbi:replication restart DNA helicase PriA [Salsuginibacillus halophilus]|uniref:Replication restart protein PriA n=1 Tax=Salsuginibacillus halophilus TaxID=517424 RepID=A0A2P8HY42_9BACI|nr:primosomal protein N' [Salsuginibacillus halophilus]PSL51139.1 replication restart DNA helicase PriA [Salsuginibacillus halophilus]